MTFILRKYELLGLIEQRRMRDALSLWKSDMLPYAQDWSQCAADPARAAWFTDEIAELGAIANGAREVRFETTVTRAPGTVMGLPPRCSYGSWSWEHEQAYFWVMTELARGTWWGGGVTYDIYEQSFLKKKKKKNCVFEEQGDILIEQCRLS